MTDELELRIHEALDARRAFSDDPEVAHALAADPAAATLAHELATVDEALRGFVGAPVDEHALEDMAARIELALDDDVSFLDDATSPPLFDEPGDLAAVAVAGVAAAPVARVGASPVPSAAPAPQPAARGRFPTVAVGALAAAACLGLFFATGLLMEAEPAPVATAPVEPAAPAAPVAPGFAPAPTAPAAPVPTIEPEPEPEPEPTVAEATSAPEAAASPSEEPLGEPTATSAARTPTVRRPRRRSATGGAQLMAPTAASMASVMATRPTVGPEAAPEPSLPRTLMRSRAHLVLVRLLPRVQRCAPQHHGLVPVRIVVSGRTGEVERATVGGALEGSAAASCVERLVLAARLHRFSDVRAELTFPYRLEPGRIDPELPPD